MPSNFGMTESIHITFFQFKYIKYRSKSPRKDILTHKIRQSDDNLSISNFINTCEYINNVSTYLKQWPEGLKSDYKH